MKPEEFVSAYERALRTQEWESVEPLMSEKVSVTFSNGIVNTGIQEVRKAFEHNFSKIKSEKYSMENVKWLITEELFSVYLFEFSWTGIVAGQSVSGNGIGTAVIIKEEEKWKLLTEHLGSKPK